MKTRHDWQPGFVHGLLPMSLYDLAGLETWLGDRAARGLHLKSMKRTVTFEKGAPQRMTYRVEPCSAKKDPSEEKRAMYGEYGWEYVCAVNKSYYIWRNGAENPRELHTDAVVEAELLESLYRQHRALMLATPILMIFAVAMIGFAFFMSPHSLLFAVQGGGSQGAMLVLALVYCFLIGTLLRDYVASGRLIRQMKEGKPRAHHRKLRWMDLYSQKAVLAVACLGALLSFTSLYWTLQGDRINLTDYAGPLPTVTLAEIENDPALTVDPATVLFDGVDWGNSISVKPTELAFSVVEISEQGVVPSRTGETSAEEYHPGLSTEYYQLRFGFLAKPLLTQMVDDDLEYKSYDTVTVSQLHDTPFDDAFLLLRGTLTQILLARLDGRVIRVQYSGSADLTAHLDAIAQRMADFVPIK